jgi:hypothetical protein
VTLEEAWAEFEAADETEIHVGMLEAMQMLQRGSGGGRRQEPLTPEQEAQGRFLDWLLYVKKERGLAYQYLRKVGQITVGPRQYWATDQRGRRAIAWESRYSYPDSDSEIWDVIMVDGS